MDDFTENSFLNSALAYIEVGYIAASAESPMRHNSDYQNALAYQLFHAIELFYKHMIRAASGEIEPIHDLFRLEQRYNTYYSDASYALEHPFKFSLFEDCSSNTKETQFINNHLNRFKPQYMSQHLRYPPDRRTGGYSYNIDKTYFKEIRDRMIQITNLII